MPRQSFRLHKKKKSYRLRPVHSRLLLPVRQRQEPWRRREVKHLGGAVEKDGWIRIRRAQKSCSLRHAMSRRREHSVAPCVQPYQSIDPTSYFRLCFPTETTFQPLPPQSRSAFSQPLNSVTPFVSPTP